jgi:hypothetical protein
MHPILEKLPKGADGRPLYPVAFEEVWAVFPKRKGSNPKGKAYTKWHARAGERIPAATLFKAVSNYGWYCRDEKIWGTMYVVMAATFFGPSLMWEDYMDYETTRRPEFSARPCWTREELRPRTLI